MSHKLRADNDLCDNVLGGNDLDGNVPNIVVGSPHGVRTVKVPLATLLLGG